VNPTCASVYIFTDGLNVNAEPSLHDLLAHRSKLVNVDGFSHMQLFIFECVASNYFRV
jgi:hypothetical protein